MFMTFSCNGRALKIASPITYLDGAHAHSIYTRPSPQRARHAKGLGTRLPCHKLVRLSQVCGRVVKILQCCDKVGGENITML